jgi:anti-sigma28 factor (negative regulator of flagellin synthesis)
LKAQLVQFETTFSAKQANLQAGINQEMANAAKEYQLFLSSRDPNQRAYHLSENQAWVQTAQENRNRMAHNVEVAARARDKIDTAVTQDQKELFADQDLLAEIKSSIKNGNAEVADLELKLQGLRMDKLKQGWGFTSVGPNPRHFRAISLSLNGTRYLRR